MVEMKIFKSFEIPKKYTRSIILIGNFDGLHSGHQKLFKEAKDEHLVRLHIGLEDPKDLIADLKKALKYIK